jgi:hypothetical protein
MVLKTLIASFLPKTPQKAQMHHLLNNNTLSVACSPPTSKQIDYPSRHNPRQPESIEENIPYGTSNLTMKEKMVHRLSILFAHNTPINHDDVLLLKIVYGKDLP